MKKEEILKEIKEISDIINNGKSLDINSDRRKLNRLYITLRDKG